MKINERNGKKFIKNLFKGKLYIYSLCIVKN